MVSIKPLKGLQVIEGPGYESAFLGRMLADLGCTVSKVDSMDSAENGLDNSPNNLTAYKDTFGLGKCPIKIDQVMNCLGEADILIWSSNEMPDGWNHNNWQNRFPKLIFASISPFGLDGPFSERPSSDLVNNAMSGYLNLTGLPGHTPIKPTIPFVSYRHACNHALAGILLAIRHRRRTNRGSLVDVAARDTGLWMLANSYQYWDLDHINRERHGNAYSIGDMNRMMPSVFPCKDGLVVWIPLAGRQATGIIALVNWMSDEGAAPNWLKSLEWESFELHDENEISEFLAPFISFFKTKSKSELFEGAIQFGFMLSPVQSFHEMLSDPQLEDLSGLIDVSINQKNVRLPKSPVRISNVDWSPS